MRKLIHFFFITLAILFFSKEICAQQISLYDHYFFNPTLYNPAFAGNKETSNIMLLSNHQWSGMKGAPTLNALVIDGKVFNEKTGLAALIYSDSKGINKTIGGNMMYANRIKINKKSLLSFGVSFNFMSRKINFTEATVQNESDPTLFNSPKSKMNFNGSIGFAYISKKLEIGIVMNQILNNKSSYYSENKSLISYSTSYHLINSYKYTFTLNEEKKILLKPQALIRYVKNAPIQFEINNNLYYKNMFWIGAAYKHSYAIATNAGITILDKYDIGYSYNFKTSGIGPYVGTTHEVMLNIKLGVKKKKEKEKKEKRRKRKEEIVIEEQKKEEKIDSLKKIDPRIIILSAKAKDFKDDNGKTPKLGAYIVVGSFKDQEYSKKYSSKIKAKGYNNTAKFYSEKRGYNYVYMFKEPTIKSALKKIDQAQKDGSKEAWIIFLTE